MNPARPSPQRPRSFSSTASHASTTRTSSIRANGGGPRHPHPNAATRSLAARTAARAPGSRLCQAHSARPSPSQPNRLAAPNARRGKRIVQHPCRASAARPAKRHGWRSPILARCSSARALRPRRAAGGLRLPGCGGAPAPCAACRAPRKSPRHLHARTARLRSASAPGPAFALGLRFTAQNAVRSGALASLHSLGYARGIQRGCIRTSCAVALPAVGFPFRGLFRSPPPLAPSAPPPVSTGRAARYRRPAASWQPHRGQPRAS